MNIKRKFFQISQAVLVLLALTGCAALNANAATTALQASGTIEATEVNVAPQMSGKIDKVLVAEGDPVKSGDVLLVMNGALLQGQEKVAAAGLSAAQANLQAAQAAVASAENQYALAQAGANQQDQADLSQQVS